MHPLVVQPSFCERVVHCTLYMEVVQPSFSLSVREGCTALYTVRRPGGDKPRSKCYLPAWIQNDTKK
jgi:hypothetical protein